MLWHRLKRHWIKIGLWLFVFLPLITSIIANAILLALMFWPKSFGSIDFRAFERPGDHFFLAVHGSGGKPEVWAAPLIQSLGETYDSANRVALDWSQYSMNPLRCAIDGSRIGQRIGERLLRNPTLRSVHLIGHSCGAFVIYKACQAIKSGSQDIQVQTTYLDPVSIYGPWLSYGVTRFGNCADYSEAYIDTGDNVAGSNELLPNTHTYDVTNNRLQQSVDVNPHVWPALFYLSLVRQGDAPMLLNTPDLPMRYPKGVMETRE